jgi:hypothetical protein
MDSLWHERAAIARVVRLCVFVSAATALPALAGVDFKGEIPSSDVRDLAEWALHSRDAKGKPFAVVDKKGAKLFVFHGNGELAGATPALLGQTPGDHAVPGAGTRVSALAANERTTPAGRFESEPGHNHKGEAIVWFDYDAALAIHRLRPADPSQRRPQRLASDTPEDNRISLGCVVVEPGFYQRVVATTLGRQRGVVYVMPETREWAPLFGANLSKPVHTPAVTVASTSDRPANPATVASAF